MPCACVTLVYRGMSDVWGIRREKGWKRSGNKGTLENEKVEKGNEVSYT